MLHRRPLPAQIFRLDLATGARELSYEVPYRDPAAILPDSLRVRMAENGQTLVYSYQKHLADLFLVEGYK